jgi:hypothetical protein
MIVNNEIARNFNGTVLASVRTYVQHVPGEN